MARHLQGTAHFLGSSKKDTRSQDDSSPDQQCTPTNNPTAPGRTSSFARSDSRRSEAATDEGGFEGGFEDGGEDGGEEATETEVAAQDERASEPHGKHTGFTDTPRA